MVLFPKYQQATVTWSLRALLLPVATPPIAPPVGKLQIRRTRRTSCRLGPYRVLPAQGQAIARRQSDRLLNVCSHSTGFCLNVSKAARRVGGKRPEVEHRYLDVNMGPLLPARLLGAPGPGRREARVAVGQGDALGPPQGPTPPRRLRLLLNPTQAHTVTYKHVRV